VFFELCLVVASFWIVCTFATQGDQTLVCSDGTEKERQRQRAFLFLFSIGLKKEEEEER
jgi:predicted nucleic acid-binding Zn ribbon protein